MLQEPHLHNCVNDPELTSRMKQATDGIKM